MQRIIHAAYYQDHTNRKLRRARQFRANPHCAYPSMFERESRYMRNKKNLLYVE